MRDRAVARGSGILTLLVVATRVSSAQPVPDAGPTDAEVFDRVFKERPGNARAPVVLVIDGVADSTIVLELPRRASPIAPVRQILDAILPRLHAGAAKELGAVMRGSRVSIDALRAAGLSVIYDPRKLELQITIPTALMRRASHDLGGRAPPDAAGALVPSDVSGYVNMRGGAGTNRRDGDTEPSSSHANLDSAINIHGWVLEGRVDLYQTRLGSEPVGVHRGDVLLSYDIPTTAVRYLVGDFAVPLAGPQPSFPVLGIGMGRNFALQPYRVVQPVGTFDFTLDSASTVTVLVNGAPVQTLTLAAGRHDVRDLPLAAGVNEVVLAIRDGAGIERRISFSTASPNELLAPGVVQFSLGVGFPLTSDVDLRTYDFSRPILSGRRRWGVTPKLTFGTSFDGTLDRSRGGVELAAATTLGNVSFDASAGCDLGEECGHAETLRYDYTRGAPGTANTFVVIGHRFSPSFHDITSTTINHYRDDATLSTSRSLGKRLVGRLNLKVQRGRAWPDAREISLGFARSFGGLGTSALLTARDDGITREARLFVSAQWVFAKHRGSMHAVSRTSTATGLANEITYVTRSGPPPGGMVSSITAKQSQSDVGAGGSLGYTGDRFTSTASLATAFDLDDRRTSQSAALELSTAVVFAGGRVAWSRPVAGSFVIIDRNRALDGVAVEVNPLLGGHAAEANAFGPAVVPNFEAYRVGKVTVAAHTLPLGASLGPTSYAIVPTYKSGTLIRVGEPGTVFVRGTLFYPEGEALAFVFGEATSLDHPDRPPLPLMTNRIGRFSMTGLSPGRYAIRLSGSTFVAAEIEVPRGFTGVLSAGIVTVRREDTTTNQRDGR